jgi:hypothetical protein
MSMFAFSSFYHYYGVNFHLVGLHLYASGVAKLDLVLLWFYNNCRCASYPKYKKSITKKVLN